MILLTPIVKLYLTAAAVMCIFYIIKIFGRFVGHFSFSDVFFVSY